MFKVNNKNARTTSITPDVFIANFGTYFTPFSTVFYC